MSLFAGSTSRWVDGVLFTFEGFPKIPEIIKENLEGIIHWESLNFTEMPTFKDSILVPGTNQLLRVINNSSTEGVVEAIKWLKNNHQDSKN